LGTTGLDLIGRVRMTIGEIAAVMYLWKLGKLTMEDHDKYAVIIGQFMWEFYENHLRKKL
jgi:hypothetical protein